MSLGIIWKIVQYSLFRTVRIEVDDGRIWS